MKRLVALVLSAAALSFTAAASADNPALTFSPNPVSVGDSIVFSGCGYVPGQTYLVQAVHNTKAVTVILQIGEVADANGCISTADYPYFVPEPGKWTATVWSGIKHLVTINFNVA